MPLAYPERGHAVVDFRATPGFVSPPPWAVGISSGLEAALGRLDRAADHRYAECIDARTTTVEIDSALLRRLRSRNPEQDDRAVIEDIARASLGFQMLREVQERSSDDGDVLAAEAAHTVWSLRRDAA